jgi:hypothetical protein
LLPAEDDLAGEDRAGELYVPFGAISETVFSSSQSEAVGVFGDSDAVGVQRSGVSGMWLLQLDAMS